MVKIFDASDLGVPNGLAAQEMAIYAEIAIFGIFTNSNFGPGIF